MSKEKKYRFYYSRKQNAVDEDMWGFTPRYTFVKTLDGYKQYSELCSIKGTRCNWEDAELVYEADEMPEIIVHEAIPELIADLESKLAESERSKEINIKERDKICLEMATDYNKQILELKQQLAEKDQTIEGLQKINKSLGQTCNNDAKEIERLREQLHIANQETLHFQNKYFAEKQIAIEQLEKVKQQLFNSFDGVGLNTYCEKVKPVENFIDQQINELKGEK